MNGNNTTKWYMKSGNEGDVVISTRIRLARNLRSYPFPNRMSQPQRQQCDEKIRDALLNGNSTLADHFEYLGTGDMSEAEIISLVERHLISPEFARQNDGKFLLMDDESVSIMLNEEDHIRLQVMRPGLDLDGAYETADKIDTLLDEQLEYAFDDKLGYLTQCPTNLGTGMRASVMLHLPALQDKGIIPQLANTVSKLGLTIRGLYGEGTEPKGAIYQLSNQVTLGISEKAAITNLMGITKQVIAQERSYRESMKNDIRTVDAICRSYGILSTARILSGDEFMRLISNVRLGVATGIIEDISLDTISALMVSAQAGMITAKEGHSMDAAQRDIKRAQLVRETIKQ